MVTSKNKPRTNPVETDPQIHKDEAIFNSIWSIPVDKSKPKAKAIGAQGTFAENTARCHQWGE
jgi:hypothetical protein